MSKTREYHHGDYRIEQDDGTYAISSKFSGVKYPEYLPVWNPKEYYPPYEFYEHTDPGSRADASYPNLLPAGAKFTKKSITPKLGVEIDGIQLSQLDAAGKDELALLVAKQGFAVFRNQDWVDHGPKWVAEYGKHFGPLHIHPHSGAPKGSPELHIVYRPGSDRNKMFDKKASAVLWHSDNTYELQPPGITFFAALQVPETGSDTLYADTVEAFNRLSPEFQKRLEGLHVLHDSSRQARNSRNQGGLQKRDPVKNIHPLVRVIPSTGQKALFVNPQFAEHIVELKDEESEALLTFLYDHMARSHDLQARASYQPGTVVIWDNRRVLHAAIHDDSSLRHCVRLTPTYERPVDDLKNLNKPDVNHHFSKDLL